MTKEELKDHLYNHVKLIPNSFCWEWTKSNDGRYGLFHKGKPNQKAHRVSWELHNESIPKGMCICHTCDNPLCVNPDHLFIGTMKDNMQDMVAKERHVGKHKFPMSVLRELKGKGTKYIRSLGYSESHASRLNRGLIGDQR